MSETKPVVPDTRPDATAADTIDTTCSASPASAPSCPVGEPSCPVIDRVIALEQDIRDLQQQALTDPLTGLGNLRQLLITLDQEMERSRRSGQPTALIMLDLDFFKKVNDTWGHDAGNQALIQTAAIIRENTRVLDSTCRYGGEEFVIVLPTTGLLIARQVAERLRAQIEGRPLDYQGQQIGLTASLGVATYNHSNKETPEAFIDRTDKFLYQAKQSGRNRVCFEVVDRNHHIEVSQDEKAALSNLFGNSAEEPD